MQVPVGGLPFLASVPEPPERKKLSNAQRTVHGSSRLCTCRIHLPASFHPYILRNPFCGIICNSSRDSFQYSIRSAGRCTEMKKNQTHGARKRESRSNPHPNRVRCKALATQLHRETPPKPYVFRETEKAGNGVSWMLSTAPLRSRNGRFPSLTFPTREGFPSKHFDRESIFIPERIMMEWKIDQAVTKLAFFSSDRSLTF